MATGDTLKIAVKVGVSVPVQSVVGCPGIPGEAIPELPVPAVNALKSAATPPTATVIILPGPTAARPAASPGPAAPIVVPESVFRNGPKEVVRAAASPRKTFIQDALRQESRSGLEPMLGDFA